MLAGNAGIPLYLSACLKNFIVNNVKEKPLEHFTVCMVSRGSMVNGV